MKAAVAEIAVSQGGFEVHHYTGDDGYPAAAVFDVVYVTLYDGREFYLPRGRQVRDDDGFVGWVASYDPGRMIDRIEAARKMIDLDRWVEVLPQPSLEERFAEYAYEEAMERAGFAP